MSSQHRDPCDDNSTKARVRLHTSSVRRTQAPQTATEANSHAGRDSGGARATPIVTRGLYSLLEDEIHSNKTPRKVAAARKAGPGSRPQFLFCYLCGQQFSRVSLPIHQPQCYVKKLIEWERMDPLKRGPRPMSPKSHEENLKAMPAVEQSIGKGADKGTELAGRELDRFNELQIEHFNKNMLLKCETCGRTFLPDRLEVHQRSCKPGSASASRPVGRAVAKSATPNKTRRLAAEPATARRKEKLIPKAFPQDKEEEIDAVADVGDEVKEGEPGLLDPTTLSQTPRPSGDPDNAPNGEEQQPSTEEKSGLEAVSVARHRVEIKASHSSPQVGSLVDYLDQDIERLKICDDVGAVTPRARSPPRDETSRARYSLKSSLGSTVSKNDRTSVSLRRSEVPASSEVAGNTSVSVDSRGGDDEVSPAAPAKKIQLNNVSHFKNVQSRLNLGAKKEELPRCRFCNRTFNADRLQKHESVCLERHKAPPKSARPSATPNAAGKVVKKEVKPLTARGVAAKPVLHEQAVMAPSNPPRKSEPALDAAGRSSLETPLAPSATSARLPTDKRLSVSSLTHPTTAEGAHDVGSTEGAPRIRYCFECGLKLPFESQRFCSGCGTKLVVDA
ncbi:hypothetical protein, conserved [Trypanosoma brucei gambiense DAL972]|uniref:C2HC/C3H-type domain-containing protein n=1 Tax=Trypanosoma brucei gambiense (strain MHOM/CI/86/DAL972) TaxID=679716 RepID=D0AAP9_TRYB9|nr:hypothetical protein, conserved [Trypanosoma brucei gambiense DAL972]CBH18750.1 hypothetical protein, conserved [Trypanosoma brucei gambiense DAL972]|eukprot:XP_011781014.1 hypothetical protein, conserved [Trypanosoma brucei gambiense DAL972]